MEPTDPEALATKRDLAAVAADVLGDLAFMVSDEGPAEPPPGTIWLRCEITYRGPTAGTLGCWCSRDFAIQLAANLLGIESDESDAQTGAEDAVREFMNVFCGQLVTSWYGTAAVFSLSIPTVQACVETPGPPESDDGHWCRLSISRESFYCWHRLR